MINKEEFHIIDLYKNFGYFHVKIDKSYLKDMLRKISNDNKPHYNTKLIKKLNMKYTKNKKACLTIYSWTAYDKTLPLEKLIKIIKLSNEDWQKAKSKIISLKAGQSRGEIKPDFPIKIDKKLGSIVGHILGDGSIDSKYQQVFFSNSNKELLKEFSSHMKEIFGVKPRIWMQAAPDFGNTKWDRKLNEIDELIEGRNCGLFYPTICGLIVNEIFDNFAIGNTKKITQKIIKTNKEFKIGLLRAFFDDESTVDRQRKYIRVFQDRKNILKVIKALLKEIEIESQPLKKYVKKNKDRYYFDIYKSNNNLLKYQKEIGFTSSKKAEKLNNIINPLI